MGGCCSSRHSHLVGAPLYYYCPESFEELGLSAAALTTTGLLVDIIGLETSSIPDTFYAPAPLPYDLLFGRPVFESIKGKLSDSGFKTCEDKDCKTQPISMILSPSVSDLSKQKTWTNHLVDEEKEEEEEDSCPICFEDYEAENPKIKTNCEHDFHLSCILEWMERSDGCPICDKEVVLDDCLN